MADRQKLEIDYPTTWTYKVIGLDAERLRLVVSEAVGDRAHQVEHSRQSSSGKYVSITVKVVVEDEVTRLSIFERIKSAESVRIVL